MFPGPGGYRGRFIAWDPTAGKDRAASTTWEIKEPLAAYGGALTTAGGIAFYGTMEGWLKAVDQKSGKVLWQFKTPSGIIVSPIPYTVPPDGKQSRRALGHRWLGWHRRGRGHRCRGSDRRSRRARRLW